MKTLATLSNLTVGQTFKLNTKKTYLRLHVYVVLENNNGVVKYALNGLDKFNQTTTSNGNQKVILN